MTIQPGQRYTKNGVSIDVHDVNGGEVYVRRWPKGVESQSFTQGLKRVPIDKFMEQIKGATLTNPATTETKGKE